MKYLIAFIILLSACTNRQPVIMTAFQPDTTTEDLGTPRNSGMRVDDEVYLSHSDLGDDSIKVGPDSKTAFLTMQEAVAQGRLDSLKAGTK